MKKVYLQGKIGKLFGSEWEFDIESPIEAIDALSANNPNFIKYLQSKENEGVQFSFKTFGSDEFLSEKELSFKTEEDIIITAIPQGAGMIMGAAMSFGTSYLSGWIQNKMFGQKPRDTRILTAQTKSYIYKGAENRVEQGANVPLGYGRMKMGSNVISNLINNYEFDADLGKIYKLENGAYHLVPIYHKYRQLIINESGEDLGPLKASALSAISEGYSEMGIESLVYKALKTTDPNTGFGSNDGVYGSDISTTGQGAIEKQKLGSGFLSAGTLYYKTTYNKGVPAFFLNNYNEYNGDWGPDIAAADTVIPERDIYKSGFTILQSEPKRI